MCGIAGIYAPGAERGSIDEAVLRSMANSMIHRGPDDEGVFIDPRHALGLAFRRLSIVDLSAAGHQPMANEDGSIWIVFNGEIYNHAEHRATLESRGHVYRSRSDTETILHLYEEYGEDCVHHLRGMFAFAIWDSPRQRLFLARDRLGIKPLYYFEHAGRFIFGSEIKAILAHPGVEREVDEEALQHYLTFMIPPAPTTLFRGIRKLPAGFRMVVRSDGTVVQERYWDAVLNPDSVPRTDDYYASQARELLSESIRLRMMSDVPLGVFLSGGIDSSTNVALMARCSGARINTFSVAFEEHEAYNEIQHARLVAREFGTNHHEIVINHRDALEYLPDLVHTQDEPIADWVCVPLYFVSKLVRDSGVIVAQVGEGADELFCGYPAYVRSLSWQRRWGWTGVVPRAAWQLASQVARAVDQAGMPFADPGFRLASRMADGWRSFWGGAIAFRGHEKRRLLDTPYWRGRSRVDSGAIPDQIVRDFALRKPSADPLERMLYLELKYRLPELLLMRVDKITMSTSVEARVPFLDHKLVEFLMTVPQSAKLRGGTTKAVLKRAVAGLVPSEIINRPKQGFSAPVAEWLRGELAEPVEQALLRGSILRRGYFSPDFVRQMIDDHAARRADHSVHLWNLFNLELWYRHWVDRSA